MPQKIAPLSSQLSFSPIPIDLLLRLRWVAILGQLVTILFVYFILHFDLPVSQIFIVISLSVVINLFFSFSQSKRHFIPEKEVLFYLLYDLGQLVTVLYLSGGLNNPFTVLILAPTVIAAGFLPIKKSIILYIAAVLSLIFLSFSPYLLPWKNTGVFLPIELRIGIGIALTTGIIFIAFYVTRVMEEARRLNNALQASRTALAREQRLASLGALAAAAAHELGSPLTTITLIIKDLISETTLPSAHSDLSLIMDQLHRCRSILTDLAKNFAGEKTLPYDKLPLSAAIDLITQRLPKDAQKRLIVIKKDIEEPLITVTPELIHGLYNVIENGWQYAVKKLMIILEWQSPQLKIIIQDDGPGYNPLILNRLGEPYVSGRTAEDSHSHLGLGLFIAQTLLAQINGKMYFKNNKGAYCLIEFKNGC